MDERIKLKIDELSDSDKVIVLDLVEKHFEKLQRKIENVQTLNILIKPSHTEGSTKLYSVETSAVIAQRKFSVDTSDWNLKTSIHDSFNKLETELEHHYHLSTN